MILSVRHSKLFLIALFQLTAILPIKAQMSAQEIENVKEEELFSLSIEELTNLEVVSSTKQRERISDAPSIISVITTDDISKRGYQSIAEALESISGIDIITDHFQPNVGIRGISSGMRSYSRIIKVLIDGQTISYNSTADNYLDESLIPIATVERIEVIKGPNSALYGADAYLGVVNIITKKGSDFKNGLFYINGGFLQKNIKYSSNIVYGGSTNNIDYLATVSFLKSDRSGLTPEDLPGMSKYEGKTSKNDIKSPKNAFAKISYDNQEYGTFGIDMHIQNIKTYGEFQDWAVLSHKNKMGLYNSYLRSTYVAPKTKETEFDISVTYVSGTADKNEQLNIGTDEVIFRESKYNGIEINSKLQYNLKQKNNITIGVDYTEHNHVHQTFYTVEENGAIRKHPDWVKNVWAQGQDNEVPNRLSNNGVYVQMRLNPYFLGSTSLRGLSFTGGIRFDMHSVYGNEPTYRAAIVYNINKNIYSKLLAGSSFKAPSSSQLYTNFIIPRGVIGNPDLKPEHANIVDWQIAVKPSKNMFLSVNAFHTTINNKVELFVPLRSPTVNIQAHNLNKIESYGIEAEIKANIKDIETYTTYSYQNSQIIKTNDKDPAISYKYQTSLYPTHIVTYGINKKIPKLFLNINLNGKYISERIASEENTRFHDKITYLVDFRKYLVNRYTLKSYILINGTLSTTDLKLLKTETKFTFKVVNILNTQHYYPGFREDFDIPGLNRSFETSISLFF